MERACPQCGDRTLREITPGFFECESPIDASIPPGINGPAWQHGSRPCGHRFQAETPIATELCACGRQSIGRCLDCSQPLCGLHGTDRGAFLCAACHRARGNRAEQEERRQFEAAVAVVRKRQPVTASVPAELSAPRAAVSPALFGDSVFDRDFDRVTRLWADGLRHGHENLVGLAWTEAFSGGLAWQIVHYYKRVKRSNRTVKRLFRDDYTEEYVETERGYWTVYGYFQTTDRLCDILHLGGSELLDSWRRAENHAEGNYLQDFRWEPVPSERPTSPNATTISITFDRAQSIVSQLESDAERLAVTGWAGLTWVDEQGQRCRVTDDGLAQHHHSGRPLVYRILVLDRWDGDEFASREVLVDDVIEPWFNALTETLGEGMEHARFEWAVPPS